jgi:hypothetical protein
MRGTMVCLHSSDAVQGWPVSWDRARVVELPEGRGLDERAAAAATAIERLGTSAHVLASGDDGAVAVRLATTRPELVSSLLLADCDPVTRWGDVTSDLPRVAAPTLVLCAAPGGRTAADGAAGIAASQRLAGEIDNGVFVVIDHAEPPAHAAQPASVDAWIASFVSIVDGLESLVPRVLNAPAPITDGEER